MFRTKPALTEIDPAQAAARAVEGRLTLVDVREIDERRALGMNAWTANATPTTTGR